jgi:hypothetical protein
MNTEWVTEIRDQCLEARVPFFFKQWGGTNKKKAGRLLEGRFWDEIPSRRSSTDGSPAPAAASDHDKRVAIASRAVKEVRVFRP